MPRREVACALVAGLVVCLAAVPAGAATLTRGPYLQLLTTDSVTVVWNTDGVATCGLAIGAPGDPATVIGGDAGAVCAIPVGSLLPGTEYGYVPLANGSPLRSESVFRTDDPSRSYRFLALGDNGSGSLSQLAVRDAMLRTPADFILSTGDMIYDDGAPEDFDPKFFRPYEDLIRRLVFWPVLGNHDVRTLGGAPWRDAFYTPANNPAGSEHYYSFDFGNAHVAVLDSNASTSPGSAQYLFLDQDLGASTATWKFVAFHHTIYSSGGHGSSTTIRSNLVPLFDRHAVDMVLMGHDHHYERTVPLRADQPVAPGAGTVYITTGGGGRSADPVGQSSFTAYAESVFHFTRVAVDGTTLLAQMIRDDGTIGDSVTLVKGAAPPPPRCGDGLVNQPGEECDGSDRPACAGACAPDCTCAPVCGDGQVDPGEACDGAADAACPGLCLSNCSCGGPADFVILSPVGDTYVEAGTEATWDHGLAPHLDVDRSPFGIAYLKFDLSGVTVPVARATLTVFCTNTSADGGSVYPVTDSTWIEGDRTGSSGSAGGPGLKWTDVDTNGDAKVDGRDTSPFVPVPPAVGGFGAVVAGQSRAIDVTRAFQGGPLLATIAIMNDSSDGATYSSDDHATVGQRPLLRLELTRSAATTTTTATSTSTATTTSTTTTTVRPSTTTATSSTGTTSSSLTTTTTAAPGTTTTSTLVFAAVADTYVDAGAPTQTFGAAALIEADNSPVRQAFARFAVSGIGSASVRQARLRVTVGTTQQSAQSNSGGTVHRISNHTWSEAGTSWNNRPAIDGPALATRGAVAANEIVDFDVTGAVAGDGVHDFAIVSTSTDGVRYLSREAAGGQPRLIVTIGPPATGTTQPPTTTTSAPPSASTSTTSSTTTTTTSPPATLDLTPVADTYVEAGTEATWDHGRAGHLDVDRSPFGITYLKFDLRGLSRPIATATLTLYCTNATSDGGTLYPVADSTWIEGDRTGADAGSATGPGLKWNDVDTDRNGKIGAGDVSPLVPDFTRPVAALGAVAAGRAYTVDVTAAVTGGPGVYTLALRNGTGDGATYSSRDHATAGQRPRLRVTLR